ncbi:hypothetical protein [Pontibacter mangrovi]|uniref:Viral A-type inclusion protein n=1 Tax=Pontibacter mangrovi TaxID=2589816 RepID=A0A501VX83_9BACT|nr:hypothetical protein [Pontibacter mangrovi]TPE41042.1 hypothetical protein FJM65_19550 [Pontibacter mangrovi]
MKKQLLLLALPLALLSACQEGSSGDEEKTALQDKVMAVHDEAMARMDDTHKLRRALRSLQDSLQTAQADTATLQPLAQELSGLEKADEAMMAWMHQYQAPDSLEHEQAMDYLQDQLQKIERVQTLMDSTLEAAQSTLNKYEQEK